MTLQDLRYVVALADHGHFGRAAAACDIGQSTLSSTFRISGCVAERFRQSLQEGGRDLDDLYACPGDG
jgi:hypothetical protein